MPTTSVIPLKGMAAENIDSDQYVDGSIDLAHIATNQIDETLMKDAFIGDFSDVTVTAADTFLYGDATDSGNTKKDTIQGILDLAGGGGSLVFIASVTANDVATIDFLSNFSATYDNYFVTFSNVHLVNEQTLELRIALGGSAQSGSTDYRYTSHSSGAAGGAGPADKNSEGASAIRLGNNDGDQTGENKCGQIYIMGANGTDNYKLITFDSAEWGSAPQLYSHAGVGMYDTALTALSGIQFITSSGNVATGDFHLYGLAKS